MPDRVEDKPSVKDLLGRLLPGGRRDAFAASVRAGNAARDGERWREAAGHYEAALAIRPDHPGVLIQFGHVLKESRDYRAAEAAYLKALALRPDDVDLLVQLGHFYKLSDNVAQALHHYRQAISRGSDDTHALHYIEQAEKSGLAQAAGGETIIRDRRSDVPVGSASAVLPAIYFDITGLVAHLGQNRMPTQLQRWVMALIKTARSIKGPTQFRACAYARRTQAFVEIDLPGLMRLIEQAAEMTDAAWNESFGAFRSGLDGARPLAMPRGAALMSLAPHWSTDEMPVIRLLKNDFGVRYIPAIYDLAPSITPEHWPPEQRGQFADWLSAAILHADAIVATSRRSRDDVLDAARQLRADAPTPIIVTPDAALPTDSMSENERRRVLDRLDVTASPFVLSVAPPEARGNQHLAFQIWARLVEREGADKVPALVCVNEPGWTIAHGENFLQAHPDVAEKVFILSGVSDSELSALYSACLFTLYLPTHDGWGLPVSESLHHGRACLTVEHTSLPEAGGRFADYCAGDSLSEIAEKTWKLIADGAYRRTREQLITSQYHARGWPDLVADLVSHVTAQLQAIPAAPVIAPVVFGELYEMRRHAGLRQPSPQAAVAEMLRHERGWHSLEDWGTWTARSRAVLAFRLPEWTSADSDALIYLDIRSAGEPTTLVVKLAALSLVQVKLGAFATQQLRLKVPRSVLAAQGGKTGLVMLSLNVDGLAEILDQTGVPYRVGVGIKSFAICVCSDSKTRLKMIERCMIQGKSPTPVAQ